jgi:hypothetical protein
LRLSIHRRCRSDWRLRSPYETDIDKALSAALGYGTHPYLRYNLAATLDSGPLITKAPRFIAPFFVLLAGQRAPMRERLKKLANIFGGQGTVNLPTPASDLHV